MLPLKLPQLKLAENAGGMIIILLFFLHLLGQNIIAPIIKRTLPSTGSKNFVLSALN